MEDYIKLGTYKALELEYELKRESINSFMRKRETQVAELYPKLYKKYDKAKKSSRKGDLHAARVKAASKRRECHLETLTLDKLDTLPKVIKYRKFLDFLNNYNTGGKDGNKLIELAATRGIKVVL